MRCCYESFLIKIYKSKYFTSKLSCFVVPQVGCSSLPVGPAGTLELSAATCGDSTGEIKIGCDSVVGGDETLQVVGTPVSNSSESLPSVLVPTTKQVTKKINLCENAEAAKASFDLRNRIFLSQNRNRRDIRRVFLFYLKGPIISRDRFITYRRTNVRLGAARAGNAIILRSLAFPSGTITISGLGRERQRSE